MDLGVRRCFEYVACATLPLREVLDNPKDDAIGAQYNITECNGTISCGMEFSNDLTIDMFDLSHCSLILGCFKKTSDTNKPPPAGRAQRRAERSTIRDLHLQLAALVGDGDPGRSTGQVALAAILPRDGEVGFEGRCLE